MNVPTYEVFQGSNMSNYYWRLRAGNGQIQCVSEAYVSKRNASRGASAARRSARVAVVKVL